MRLTQTLKLTITALTLVLLTTACSDSPSQIKSLKPGSDLGKRLQMALLDARPGDVIVLPAGKYDLLRSLSLTVDGVTIRGAGRGAGRGADRGRRGASRGRSGSRLGSRSDAPEHHIELQESDYRRGRYVSHC